jgi:hypothetical protein
MTDQIPSGFCYRLICPLYNGRAHFEQVEANYPENAADSIFRLDEFTDSLSFPSHLNFEGMRFNEKANIPLCDNLTASFLNEAQGIIIHQRLFDFMTQFSLPVHQSYPIRFTHKNKLIKEYVYLFFSPSNIPEAIDFSLSSFYLRQGATQKVQQFKHLNAFQTFRQNFPEYQIYSKQLILLKEHPLWQQDIWSIQAFNQGLYMSEKMKKAWDNTGFNGFRFLKKKFLS